MDEPTNGLDPFIKEEFFKILKEENQKGATIFYSANILNEVQEICDKVAIIKERTIIDAKASMNLEKIHIRKYGLP